MYLWWDEGRKLLFCLGPLEAGKYVYFSRYYDHQQIGSIIIIIFVTNAALFCLVKNFSRNTPKEPGFAVEANASIPVKGLVCDP